MTAILVFDIETVPDTEGFRKLHNLDLELSSADIAEMAFQSRRQVIGTDFYNYTCKKS